MNQLAKLACLAVLCNTIFAGIVPSAQTQTRSQDAATIARRNATEKELESIAIIERKVMVPMRDGKRMPADIYRPKDESKKYPIIFVRTPYNFNYWDVKLGAPRDMSTELDAVKRGYAYIEMNERGQFFSEGDYDILGAPLSDGDDALTGCRASPGPRARSAPSAAPPRRSGNWAWPARQQTARRHHPGGFGAGVGRVGPYYEQGNWFRGGAVQMLFGAWLYGRPETRGRPYFPPACRNKI